MDHDDIEINNLHRQILHSEEDIGMSKTDSALHKLKRYKVPYSNSCIFDDQYS